MAKRSIHWEVGPILFIISGLANLLDLPFDVGHTSNLDYDGVDGHEPPDVLAR